MASGRVAEWRILRGKLDEDKWRDVMELDKWRDVMELDGRKTAGAEGHESRNEDDVEEEVEYGCKNSLINYENMLSDGLISAVINVQLISVRIDD